VGPGPGPAAGRRKPRPYAGAREEQKLRLRFYLVACSSIVLASAFMLAGGQGIEKSIFWLSTGKALVNPVPGQPQRTNSFPTTLALSPDGRYLAALNNGYGTLESHDQQSIAVLDLRTNQLTDYPDSRLGRQAHQSYFLGLAFSGDGKRLYASIASLTDPEGKQPESTGNGIAVYSVDDGHPAPQRFIKIAPQPLRQGARYERLWKQPRPGEAIPYPAGLTVVHPAQAGASERILVADNLSDDALLLDAESGAVIHRYDLSTKDVIPASYPYTAVATRDGKRGYCSLWNASQVAELDLESGAVTRRILLLLPSSPIAAGSHPTAMLLSPDEKYLYVALANRDRVAVVRTATGELAGVLSTELPGQTYGGVYPNALAQTADGSRLFVADAAADAVAIFNMAAPGGFPSGTISEPLRAAGFIPTEWYPTALAVEGDDLFIASGKGQGTGPNSALLPADPNVENSHPHHPYIATLIYGSIARVNMPAAQGELAKLTDEVIESNRMRAPSGTIEFRGGHNPIRHVIYIIKENRTYDQILGDLKPGDGDPTLVMYGEDITPNQHKLAREFGILDNFYDSGEVSGDGHPWSMAAIVSDYTEDLGNRLSGKRAALRLRRRGLQRLPARRRRGGRERAGHGIHLVKRGAARTHAPELRRIHRHRVVRGEAAGRAAAHSGNSAPAGKALRASGHSQRRGTAGASRPASRISQPLAVGGSADGAQRGHQAGARGPFRSAISGFRTEFSRSVAGR